MIGKRLAQMLIAKGDHQVIILTRNPVQYRQTAYIRYAGWDVKRGKIDEWAIREADAVVHLAGASVMDKPWTPEYMELIRTSRTATASILVNAMKNIPNNIGTVVSGSAIGYYNETGKEQASKESDAPASGFLGETCVAWENAMTPVTHAGKRLVYIRTGIVLSKEGGALKEFLKPLQFHVAGILGDGKQIVSWIHIDDLCRAFIHVLENESLSGPYNGVAPNPVTNKELNLALARAMHGKTFISLPVPSFAIKLLLGSRSIEVLKSANVSAEKILASGFAFQYPTIEEASQHLLQNA